MEINPALIGKAGEVLVAGELMRQGIEIAYPASDRGIDLLAYRLTRGQIFGAKFVPIQVKARARSGFSFQRSWFDRVPGIALVYVWHLEAPSPQFYVFDSVAAVEEVLGLYAKSPSWLVKGGYNVTTALQPHYDSMKPYLNKWELITNQLLFPSP